MCPSLEMSFGRYTKAMYWVQFLTSVSVAIVLHESAHFVLARLQGYASSVVVPPGAVSISVREPGAPLQNVVISGAGPLANLISTGTIFLIPYLGTAAITFVLVSLLLGISNLLPIPGSDGHRILVLLQQESPELLVR